jgi:hypothetical protein
VKYGEGWEEGEVSNVGATRVFNREDDEDVLDLRIESRVDDFDAGSDSDSSLDLHTPLP